MGAVKTSYAIVALHTVLAAQDQDRLVEIAVIRINADTFQIEDMQETVVNAQGIHTTNPHTQKIVTQIPEIAPNLDQVILDLQILCSGRKIVGYDFMKHDLRILNSLLQERSYETIDHNACIDMLPLAKKFLRLPTGSIQEIVSHYGLEEAHPGALNEAKLYANIFIELMNDKKIRQHTYINSPKCYPVNNRKGELANWVSGQIDYSVKPAANMTSQLVNDKTSTPFNIQPQKLPSSPAPLAISTMPESVTYYLPRLNKKGTNTLPNNFAVFDLETTGTDPHTDEPVEIAIVLLEGKTLETMGEYHTLIKPVYHDTIPEGSSEVHNIYDEDVKNAPTFAQIAPDIQKLLQGRRIIGHNLFDYDLPMLLRSFLPVTYKIPIAGCIDTLLLARGLLRLPQNKLENLVAYYHLPPDENAHMALADTRATAAVFKKMSENWLIQEFVTRTCVSWADGWENHYFAPTNWMPRSTMNRTRQKFLSQADDESEEYRNRAYGVPS